MTSNELEIFKQSILDDVRVMMQTTGQVTQYIGARYVPLFADPLEWSADNEYEPLTIVTNRSNSYTSRQFVPRGVELTNEQFWVETGNFNAQIEQYRKEVEKYRQDSIKLQENVNTLSNTINEIKKQTRVFNVLEYGADPNGVEDSTNAFKSAVTAAASYRDANSSDFAIAGVEIYIPSGKYLISDSIVVPFKLLDSDAKLTAFSFVGDFGNSKIIWSGNGSLFQFSGLYIDFFNLSVTSNNTGIAFEATDNVMYSNLNNISVYGFETGLKFKSISLVNSVNLSITDCTHPLICTGCVYSNFNKLYLLSNDDAANFSNTYATNFMNSAVEYTSLGFKFSDFTSVAFNQCGMEAMNENGIFVSVGDNSTVDFVNFLAARNPNTCHIIENGNDCRISLVGCQYSSSSLNYICKEKEGVNKASYVKYNGILPSALSQGNYIVECDNSGTTTKSVTTDTPIPIFKYDRVSVSRSICCGFFTVTVIDLTNNRECAFLISTSYNGVDSSLQVINSSYSGAAGNIPFGDFTIKNTTLSFTPKNSSMYKFIVESLNNCRVIMQ